MDFQFVTPSDLIEYLFCKRFVYFIHVLKVKQHEHDRALVNKGRDIHTYKMVKNKDYLRKSVGAIDKMIDVYLSSETLKLVGRIDEVLFLDDKTAAPLDYKYAFWENKIYKTLMNQQVLYAMLIEENFNIEVNRAFIVYVRSSNHLESFPITQAHKNKAKEYLDEIFEIINLSLYPKPTSSKNRCSDCTYRNICVP